MQKLWSNTFLRVWTKNLMIKFVTHHLQLYSTGKSFQNGTINNCQHQPIIYRYNIDKISYHRQHYIVLYK